MERGIKAELDNGESILLKKDILGYRIIYPIKNLDGSWNWKNLIAGGSWIKLGLVAVVVAIIVLAIVEYTSNINSLLSCFDNYTNLETCKESFGYYNLTWLN